ncbi:sirohydrochlorin cobaltochelatase [Nitratidesulfovibrio sp. SRB-5]|uniref:sirohydrochlorin cobaltochelatase n=1 Tax=Nitratidesulfovibrio sp. SRB-5 TaxID=2872636 RepID=UPI001027EAC2|nr:sirohydrochlorin cobaltochelatase [Nitratidesulfovibrio sp. SRB-5]MBZ2171533.1 sirohydrochlorin cobaltochelatase [Nitratidesulfovibrio sp. SRB-5]RXF74863.1 sirohydrochlorin cobaltochelatase [Desulfovibrio sp. DS-1]
MKKGILLAAFGSGTPQGQSTLRLFDERVRALFPGVPVRWAFTSVVMRNRLAAARKKTDSVQKALRKMWFEKYTHVAVQSLHSIPGAEYADLLADVEDMRGGGGIRSVGGEGIRPDGEGGISPDGFVRATVGAPLLDSDDDIRRATAALLNHLPPERTPGEACVFMGHGTWHEGESRYGVLSAQVRERDPLVHIGTMDGDCTIGDILPRLAEAGVRRVWLLPLLSVVGRHAMLDMAGDAPDSWRSRIVAAGMECVPVLRGTAEYGGFVDIWLDHLGVALRALDADGDTDGDGVAR